MLSNQFGHFDSSGRRFVITDPATPMPWVNVICNGHYGLVISQNGGGFSWLDDAQHNVLTRWEMDLVRDCSGKFLYLADLDTGAIWSAAPAPCGTRHDAYLCTHEPGLTTFTTTAHGIRAVWSLAVAPEDPVEVWNVTLTNLGDRPRRVRVSSYFEWCCGVAPDTKREFHRLFLSTRHDGERGAILATKTMWDIPDRTEKDHWNRPWPYVAAHAITQAPFARRFAIADKALFIGRRGSTAAPIAMRGDAPERAGFGRFGDACAALGGDLVLEPGRPVSFQYLLAIAPDEPGVLALVDRYAQPQAAQGVPHAATEAWLTRLAPVAVESSRADFDLMNTTWLPYQAISGRLWGRTGYYQQSGARGFRDQLQDSQVWLAFEPERTLDQLMLHATRQFADGTVNHWWHALADFGNHTACSDDYLWLAFVTASYLRETGDFAALTRTAPFRDDPTPTTLLEHCRRAIARTLQRLSPRGLPLIGSCDWNDGLSAVGVEGKGESVWLGFFFCTILRDWERIYRELGRTADAEECAARRAVMASAINQHAWDGAWYRYGTKDTGEWIGSAECAEGRIHLNAQTWAILSGVATPDRAKIAWESVRKHLLSPFGPLLLAPAYVTPDPTIGYITRYAPGCRENGGVYMHAATWALWTAAHLGDVASVARIWDSISPPWRGQRADDYWAEPYVVPGNVDGPASDLPGRAGWTWYTGSAAWLQRICFESVLGVRPTWDGLTIDPAPIAELGEVRFTRLWRGVPITVRFNAGDYVPGRRARLVVNGKAHEGLVLGVADVRGAGPEGVSVEVRWSGATAAQPAAATSGDRSP